MDVTSRQATVTLIHDIIYNGRSFQTALANSKSTPENASEVQAIAYGVLRNYQRLALLLSDLVKKPLKNKDKDIELAILIAFFQLSKSNTPNYAVVNETVKWVKKGKKKWAANMVNGVLRNFCRNLETQNNTKVIELPQWMQTSFKKDWADEFATIAQQSNLQAPMSLRVNKQKTTVTDYLKMLTDKGIKAQQSTVIESGIVLDEAIAVNELPNFDKGFCSVQDLAAQLAVIILDPKENESILDACAAPGGKTCHILEKQPNIHLTACDIDKKRLERVSENLQRLTLNAKLQAKDMADKMAFKENSFDRILLDAPCSALGIIRRHPDIKFLRKPEDIINLNQLQAGILKNCWSWLKPGGVLLYATCSILKDENEHQVNQFLKENSDAQLEAITVPITSHSTVGLQILPGEHQMDGFFYSKFFKKV